MRRVALAVVAAAAVVAGCDVGPALVPVTGTVTRDGTPLAGAEVVYAPDPKARDLQTARAKSGADGRYKLATGGAWGVAPGKYRVTVTAGADLLGPVAGKSVALERQYEREVPPMGAKFDLDVTRKAPDGPRHGRGS